MTPTKITGGGNRTHTGLPPEDFKSSASAIPPRRHDSDVEVSSTIKAALDELESMSTTMPIMAARMAQNGGGGIRTHGRLAPTTVFKTVPIDHSGTPPVGSRSSRREQHLGHLFTTTLLLTDLVEDIVGDEDRHIDGHGQRDRVARP